MVRASLLFVLVVASCARPAGALIPTERSVDDVASRPGAVAWSPDGLTLAVIRAHRLELVDVASGRTRAVPHVTPSFLDWAPAHDLLVVDHGDGAPRLLRVDPAGTSAPTPLPATGALVAARWLVPAASAVTLTATVRPMSFGTPTTAQLHRVDARTDRVVFTWDTTLPWKLARPDALLGWLHATPRPVLDTVVAYDFHKPPVFAPYVRVLELDPAGGEPAELTRVEGRALTAPLTWSPSGRRLALTDADGHLVVLTPRAGGPPAIHRVPNAPPGRWPTWSPRADAIHVGGSLVTAAGGVIERLISPDRDALGVWSPDGRNIAVATAGRVLVFTHLPVSVDGDDRPPSGARLALRDQLRRLAALRARELLDADEYADRRARMLEAARAAP